MVEYEKTYTFDNGRAEFEAHAFTDEHPNEYGNGTLLVIDVLNKKSGRTNHMLFDIRYTKVWKWEGIDDIVRNELNVRYDAGL